MKKTFLWILLVSMFVFGLTSCNETPTNNDTTKPTATLKVASFGYVNEKIDILYDANDNVSAEANLKTDISVYKGTTFFDVENNGFVPEESGDYTVVLRVSDEAGNSYTTTKLVNVFNRDDELINITTPVPNLGDEVEVKYEISELITNIDLLEVNVSVTAKGEELVLDNNKFIAGFEDYTITVTLEDEYGNKISQSKVLEIVLPYRENRDFTQYAAPTYDLNEEGLPKINTSVGQAVIELSNGTLAMVYGTYRLDFVKNSNNQYVLRLVNLADGANNAIYEDSSANIMFKNDNPSIVYLRGGDSISGGYSRLVQTEYGICAIREITDSKGNKAVVKDCYYFAKENEVGAFNVRKSVSMDTVATATGFASEYGFVSNQSGTFEWFVPNLIFKNYSGSTKTYRETRMGVPMMMARNTSNGYTLSLSRYQPIVTYIDNSYASLTLNSVNKGVSVSYPANEGNKLYHEATVGAMHVYDLTIRAEVTNSYETAVPSVYNAHFNLQNQRIVNTDIDEVYNVICEDYKVFLHETEQEDEISGKKYTSYGLPWRITIEDGEFGPLTYQAGFIGQQIPSAYNMMLYGVMNNDLESLQNGVNVIDFWVEDAEMMSPAGVPRIWYDTWSDGFRSYPCFLRMAVDAMEGLFDAYLLAEAHGLDKGSWYDALEKFGKFLVYRQNEDGSYYRCYNYAGDMYKNKDEGIEEPPGNICQSESKANTHMAIRFLARMYEYTGESKYYNAALRAGEYVYENLYKVGSYQGGTCDNPNATDKESGVFAMYAYDSLYVLTGDAKWLECLKQATAFTMSTVLIYSFGIMHSDLKSALPVYAGYTDGMSFIVCSQSSGVDNYIAYIYHELFRVYILTGEETYLKQAEFIQQNTKSIMNWDGSLGYKYKSLVAEATSISSFVYGSATDGAWVTWSSVANAEPIAKMYNNYGHADVAYFKDVDIEELRARLDEVGCGGYTHAVYENTVIGQVE